MTEKGIGSICCFTGHRPEKLRSSEADVRGRLAGEIAEAIKAGYDTFITGMVEGVMARDVHVDLPRPRTYTQSGFGELVQALENQLVH